MNQTPDDPPRLAVYGTLAPGRANHGQLANLRGRWFAGSVRGHLHHAGWGADLGFPGLVLDDAGDAVEVQILESEDLRHDWRRLDEFEGAGYRRVVTMASTPTGRVSVSIYVLAEVTDLDGDSDT